MSATNRGAIRVASDFYPTPAWCVHRLLEECILPSGQWIDPGAGNGAIIKAVNDKRLDIYWTALDIRPEVEADCIATGAVFLAADFPTMYYNPLAPKFDVLITNPPFSLAKEFIEKSFQLAHNVVMLLRVNYLAGAKRAEFMRATPPDVYILPNRPSFVGNGTTDATEYAWFVWHSAAKRTHGLIKVLATTPKEDR